MRAVFLDYQSMKPEELDFERFAGATSEFITHAATPPELVIERIREFDVVILNKVKFERSHFEAAPDLKLILVSATGTDNVDKRQPSITESWYVTSRLTGPLQLVSIR